jgi:hypothetical protein
MLLFGYVYVYLFIPETKGLSLEEVSTVTVALGPLFTFVARSMKCIALESNLGTLLGGHHT